MKEFEDWFAEQMPAAAPFTHISCKQTWRAALEWVLKTERELDIQDAPIGMREVIKKELGGLY